MNRKKIKQEIKIKTNYLQTNLNKMSMKKVYLILAAVAGMTITSCTTNDYLGDVKNEQAINDGSIQFGLKMQNMTRADIAGMDAAKKLGNFFYVMGTKADINADPQIPTASPTTVPVFDNYFVQYDDNSAGTTESNTANWEYVGFNPGTTPAAYPKLSAITGVQTIKYWDYSAPQYDFFAFSTGNRQPVNSLTAGDITVATQVGVTKMNYGASISPTAYSFYIPSEDALKEVYVTDIVKVGKSNYGKEVQLQFKNLGSKVRVALYETVPGYAVSDVKFYTADVNDSPKPTASLGTGTIDNATLISTATLPTNATINVTFPHAGSSNISKDDYNKASVTVTAGGGTDTKHGFGELNYVAGENVLSGSASYLGRTLPTASFAGEKVDDYYTTVFPISSSNALTLRVDYKLTAIDGSGEVINVYGAKASVPANYTVWRPNYAYTYIFKISDNTNGWTSTAADDPAGLFPITFDAVVAAPTDANAEQTTVTTVATPSVTTYQQNHDPLKPQNEYSKATAKDIYVQVMNTAVAPATMYTDLADGVNSFVYELSEDATEAKVLDALTMRKDAYNLAADINGRNGLVLDLPDASYIDNTVTSIINGVDDNPITKISSTDIAAGEVGKIDISALTAGKSYAYVYIQTAKTKEVNMFEPVAVTVDSKINSTEPTHKYYALTTAEVVDEGTELDAAEAPSDDYVYFSVVKDGNDAKTYYYISTLGKASIPAGCIKVLKTTVTEVTGNDNAAANTFYFDKYITNDGKYAVKVIKIVA